MQSNLLMKHNGALQMLSPTIILLNKELSNVSRRSVPYKRWKSTIAIRYNGSMVVVANVSVTRRCNHDHRKQMESFVKLSNLDICGGPDDACGCLIKKASHVYFSDEKINICWQKSCVNIFPLNLSTTIIIHYTKMTSLPHSPPDPHKVIQLLRQIFKIYLQFFVVLWK